MKFDTMTANAEVRIWDENSSESFFVTDSKTYNKHGEHVSKYDCFALSVACETEQDAIAEIVAEWADGYDGNAANIRAEIIMQN